MSTISIIGHTTTGQTNATSLVMANPATAVGQRIYVVYGATGLGNPLPVSTPTLPGTTFTLVTDQGGNWQRLMVWAGDVTQLGGNVTIAIDNSTNTSGRTRAHAIAVGAAGSERAFVTAGDSTASWTLTPTTQNGDRVLHLWYRESSNALTLSTDELLITEGQVGNYTTHMVGVSHKPAVEGTTTAVGGTQSPAASTVRIAFAMVPSGGGTPAPAGMRRRLIAIRG